MQLLKFLSTRVLNAAAIALLAPFLALILLGRAPGDFLSELAANPQISSHTLAQMRADYGLDQPVYRKYVAWAAGVAKGDMGFSFVYQRPIRELIAGRVWNTVLLNGMALAIAWLLGIGVSLLTSAAPGGANASGESTKGRSMWIAGAAATFMASTPAVLVALFLLALALPLGLPVGGMTSSNADTLGGFARLLDLVRHLLLPTVAVAMAWLPAVMRHSRAALDQALGQPYITTARAKGLTHARVLMGHALPNALSSLAALFGLSVSALLSASLPVEVIMGWPGVGQLTYDAVLKRDVFLVMDLALVSALLLLIGNMLSDVLAWVTEPNSSRVRPIKVGTLL